MINKNLGLATHIKDYDNSHHLEVFSLPLIDLIDKADDRRHKIMIRMETTVKTVPPITADNMMIRGRLSAMSTLKHIS